MISRPWNASGGLAWSNDEQRMAEKIFPYLFRLVANRAHSLSQHITPPLRYASLLNGRMNNTNPDNVLNIMKSHSPRFIDNRPGFDHDSSVSTANDCL